MYSPKIIPELIPKLYRKAKERGIPMTRLVNEILSDNLKDEPEPAVEGPSGPGVYSTESVLEFAGEGK